MTVSRRHSAFVEMGRCRPFTIFRAKHELPKQCAALPWREHELFTNLRIQLGRAIIRLERAPDLGLAEPVMMDERRLSRSRMRPRSCWALSGNTTIATFDVTVD